MSWPQDAIFYHLFPLGCLGAPERNSFDGPAANRLSDLTRWIDYLEEFGVNALLLGPVFESSAHGYDIADYFRVDRRLGDDTTLAAVSRELHRRGIRLVLDVVFHHTGRDFWAFRDVREKGQASEYCDWYHLDFTRRSPYGEPFHYKGWAGNYDLVKLNLKNPAVRDHLFMAVSWWIERFEIDGLRLDAADALDLDFQRELAAHCRALRPDFWLMGEVVHGDYRQWRIRKGCRRRPTTKLTKGCGPAITITTISRSRTHSTDSSGPKESIEGSRSTLSPTITTSPA
jgi:glycosidase